MKNVIVTIQERQQQRAGKLPESAEQRYATIMTRYREREFDAEHNKQIELLESATMDEADEVAVLQAMIDEQRNRRGINPKP